MEPPPSGAGFGSRDVLLRVPVGAFAETPLPQESTVATEEQQTDETETDNGQTDASNPDPGATTEESAAPTTDEPAEENEPYTFDGEILYADMPDAPQAPTSAASVCQ